MLSFYFSVSHTTRAGRKGEKEGVDYHFVSHKEFSRMVAEGSFLEWATVYGQKYGTCHKQIEQHLESGEGIILDLDPKGALAVKKYYSQALLVFLEPPSIRQLAIRLKKRGTESLAMRKKRLSRVQDEKSYKKYYDVVLINRNLQGTLHNLKKRIKELF